MLSVSDFLFDFQTIYEHNLINSNNYNNTSMCETLSSNVIVTL